MCGQALGYEALALGLFVKLKSNVVRVHRLLSGFRQPCTWSKWASNHLEQKPFLAHILKCWWEVVWKRHMNTLVCLYVYIYVCVGCAAVHRGLSELQPGPEWLSSCELEHVELS